MEEVAIVCMLNHAVIGQRLKLSVLLALMEFAAMFAEWDWRRDRIADKSASTHSISSNFGTKNQSSVFDCEGLAPQCVCLRKSRDARKAVEATELQS